MRTGKKGPRPHVWKVQGEVPHRQYMCFLQMRAQANYRDEPFELTFEDFQEVWNGKWELKGRGSTDYCLTRDDPTGAWVRGNVVCLPRIEHLKRQRLYREINKYK
jgi:hypothetical protein